MKTRRILAASTAALLAFGTTAIVSTVASATADTVTVTVSSEITNGTVVVASTAGGTTAAGSFTSNTTYYVTATPDAGYKLGKITVKNGDTAVTLGANNSFTTPADTDGGATVAYTVTATFTRITPTYSAVLDSDDSWEEFSKVSNGATGGISAKVEYKMSEAALEKNEDWTVKVTNENGKLTSATGIRNKDDGIFKGISSTTAKSVMDEYTNSDGSKLTVLNFSVGEPDDEDWVDVGSTKLPATISLRVSDLGFKPKHVYHFTSGKLVELDSRQIKLTEDGNTDYGIEFSTKSFSPYVFTENAIKGAVAADDKDNPETSGNVSNATSTATSNGGTTTNPDTGIALAIAPVVLAAGAVAVVALKKKH